MTVQQQATRWLEQSDEPSSLTADQYLSGNLDMIATGFEHGVRSVMQMLAAGHAVEEIRDFTNIPPYIICNGMVTDPTEIADLDARVKAMQLKESA